MKLVGLIALASAAAIVLFLILYYVAVYQRNRKLGSPGIASRSRLTCPKCHQTFDYDYVPGASFTALRLGRSRYMACPICHSWSTFDLSEQRMPVSAPGRP